MYRIVTDVLIYRLLFSCRNLKLFIETRIQNLFSNKLQHSSSSENQSRRFPCPPSPSFITSAFNSLPSSMSTIGISSGSVLNSDAPYDDVFEQEDDDRNG